jgi:hypothetical protein
MAYNHRMSMAGTQQPHNRRKKEDDNDALMRLVSYTFYTREQLSCDCGKTHL